MFFQCGVKIISIILITAGMAGCMSEANFDLSSESRLPKWFEIPKGMSRSDFKVTLDTYVHSDGNEDVFKLYNKNSFFKLKEVSGVPHKIQLTNPPAGFPKGYPVYIVVTIDGITDISEHRKGEPVFYMTDDPAVWKELGVQQK